MFGKFGNRYYPGETHFKRSEFDLVAAVRAACAEIAQRDRGRHAVSFHSELDRLRVATDPEHIEYIALNLLHNAAKYSDAGTPVHCELASTNGHVELRVRDHGIGIPAAARGQLFRPFYRAANVGDRPGTGLGLTVVKQSAAAIGATVELSSTEHEGSTFTVRLPLNRCRPGKPDALRAHE